MKRTLLLVFILLTSAAQTQANNGISADHLTSYYAEFDYFVEQPNNMLTKAGTWSDLLNVTDEQLIRTVKRTPKNGLTDLIRTVAVNKTDLSPAFINQRFGNGLEGVYYSELKQHSLYQAYLANAQVPAKTSTTEMAFNMFETNLQGIFAASLPFTTASEIQVDSYIGGASPKRHSLTYTVEGEETLQVMGHEMSAWKVSEATSRWTYWVRKEAPFLVKVSHPAPDGTMLVSLLSDYTEKP